MPSIHKSHQNLSSAWTICNLIRIFTQVDKVGPIKWNTFPQVACRQKISTQVRVAQGIFSRPVGREDATYYVCLRSCRHSVPWGTTAVGCIFYESRLGTPLLSLMVRHLTRPECGCYTSQSKPGRTVAIHRRHSYQSPHFSQRMWMPAIATSPHQAPRESLCAHLDTAPIRQPSGARRRCWTPRATQRNSGWV